jgi:hypothetical protein
MRLSKLYTIELTDGTSVDVEVNVDVDDKFCENNEHSYMFDDAGLTDEQICEAESIVDNSIEEWAEAMLLGEDDEDNFDED